MNEQREAGAIHKNDTDARKDMNEIERLAADMFNSHQSHGYVWDGWYSCPSFHGDWWPQNLVSFSITNDHRPFDARRRKLKKEIHRYKVTIEKIEESA